MSVGIVVICYNHSSFVADTIKSIFEQKFPDWFCVVVDNGSTDNTIEVIEACVKGDERFLVLQKENEGPSSGRNFGYKHLPSSVQYVHFLDGDDMIKPHFLLKLCTYLEENKQVGIVCCQFDEVDESGTFVKAKKQRRYMPGIFSIPRGLRDDQFATPFVTFFCSNGQGHFSVFRNSNFQRTSFYEPDFWTHEDSDIFCQMFFIGEIHHVPDNLYKRRIHSHNITRSGTSNYGDFRKKWDMYISSCPQVNENINAALKYYYVYHRPFRDFKVAIKAFKEFVRNRSFQALKWSIECLSHGLIQVLFKHEYKRVMKERKRILVQFTPTVSS